MSRSSSSNSLIPTQPNFSVGNRRNSLSNQYSSDANISSESLVDSLETDNSLGSMDSTGNSFSRSDDNSGVRIDALAEESRF